MRAKIILWYSNHSVPYKLTPPDSDLCKRVVIEAIEGFFHRQTSFIESTLAWISEGIWPNQSSKK